MLNHEYHVLHPLLFFELCIVGFCTVSIEATVATSKLLAFVVAEFKLLIVVANVINFIDVLFL